MMDLIRKWILRLVAHSFVYVVIAVNSDGEHDQVQVYKSFKNASDRYDELVESGFQASRVSIHSKAVLSEPDSQLPYTPKWKDAVGWTGP